MANMVPSTTSCLLNLTETSSTAHKVNMLAQVRVAREWLSWALTLTVPLFCHTASQSHTSLPSDPP